MKKILLTCQLLAFCFLSLNAQNFVLIKEKTYSVKGPITENFQTLKTGRKYKLVTSGIWTDATSGSYDTRYIIKPSFKEYTGFMNRFFDAPAWIDTLTPNPKGYNSTTHEYSYYFEGDGSTMKFGFSDNGYSDNSGSVTFSLFIDSVLVEPKPKGTSLNFDGINDYITLGNTMNDVFAGAGKTFTIEAWIKPESHANTSDNGKILISKYGNSACSQDGRQFAFSLLNDGKISFVAYGSTGTTVYKGIKGSTVIPLNTWNHIVVTYDGSVTTANVLDRIKLYVNGVLENSTQYLSSGSYPLTIPSSTAQLGIGSSLSSTGTICSQSTQRFDGDMDEVRIWNTVRNCSEIVSNKDCELNGNEPNLVAYYNFNQGVADSVNNVKDTLPNKVGDNYKGLLKNFDLNGQTSNWVDGSLSGISSTICNNIIVSDCSVITSSGFDFQNLESDIYPNPADNVIQIAKKFNATSVQVYNAQMQYVTNLNIDQNKIDIENLPTGIYFLRIENSILKFLKK